MNYWDDYNPGYEDYDEPDYDADCKRAIHWAKCLFDQPFLILDSETTGLDNDAEAVEIALIDSEEKVLFNQRVKVQQPISYEASRIHGITEKQLVNCLNFPFVHSELKEIINHQKVIIYNLAFDRRILNQQCDRYNLEKFNFSNAECAMSWYSQYCGDWSDYHQSYTWQRLPGGDHSALGDCQATLAVLKKMAGV